MGRSAWLRGPGSRPLVLGHRGARFLAPENTLAAFEAAMGEGADGIELDVRLSRDDQVVVCHDPTLARSTGGRDTRALECVSWDELRRIEIDGCAIPSLASVLSWARSSGCHLNIELKPDVARRFVLARLVMAAVLAEPILVGKILLSSFDPWMVRALTRQHPPVPVGWLVSADTPFVQRLGAWRRLGAQAVHPEWPLATEPRLGQWLGAGAMVVVWTVTAPQHARRLASAGVQVLIADDPRAILESVCSL